MRFEFENQNFLLLRGVDEVSVPSLARKYPDRSLTKHLKSCGFRADQIDYAQRQLREEETTWACVDADIIVPPIHGELLRDSIYQGKGEDNWRQAGEYIKGAIARVVGEGKYVQGRRFFDVLALSEQRIAFIMGFGRETKGAWSLHDEGGVFVSSMTEVLGYLESTRRYGAFVADINNPTGYVKRVTRDSPLFYVIGDPRGNRSDLNRQVSSPTKKRL